MPLFIRYGLVWLVLTQKIAVITLLSSSIFTCPHKNLSPAWRNISMLVFATQITPVVLRVMFLCELSLRNLAAVAAVIIPIFTAVLKPRRPQTEREVCSVSFGGSRCPLVCFWRGKILPLITGGEFVLLEWM